MRAPIYEFLKKYASGDTSRFHMPGHKGVSRLGIEPYDITEIFGADTLGSADGIIKQSEDNASSLFATAHSFYSAEGSTLAIKAMLAVVKKSGGRVVLAARNAHKAFINACALLDIEPAWLYPDAPSHLCSAEISPKSVAEALSKMREKPIAVYLTSPDYLGGVLDIKGIAEVCKASGIPLLVDNAHGAYLKFLPENCGEKYRHPIELGASMCADSAHKTLPVLTGGAYLHISKSAPEEFVELCRGAMSLFASTSPSYLILASLDLCNPYLATEFRGRLSLTLKRISLLSSRLAEWGIEIEKSEPLKIVFDANKLGYTGAELAEYLRKNKIEVEFSDSKFAVLMATPDNSEADFLRLERAMSELEKKNPLESLCDFGIYKSHPESVISVRQAVLSPSEIIPVSSSLGRIAATQAVSCPPAIPIVVSGERISSEAIELFNSYGIEKIEVVKE